jgi:hypothetical protein
MHLPAGRSVVLGLNSGDVIHSFWVPALAGKVDMIPGGCSSCALDRRAGPASRPVRRVLRRAACADGARGRGRAAGAVRRLAAAQAAPAVAPQGAAAAARPGAVPREGCVACHSIRGLAEGGATAPTSPMSRSRRLIGAGSRRRRRGRIRPLDRRGAASEARRAHAGVRPARSRARCRAGGLLWTSCDEARRAPCRVPAGELEALERAWAPPRGWRLLKAVNNTHIGVFYIATALLFFVLAGVLALLMRAQLALPGGTLLGAQAYNQVFTMHGTVMMFLFAVPVVEAIAVYLLPGLLGARDLPFPRLSAYAFWAYAVGGLAFFCTIFFGVSPDGGWFMYPPLASAEHSPGAGADWWLLGIGFIEISAIAGAIELIVGILFTRAPGMTLGRMPVFAWAMLVVALMIVFAFPAIIAGTTLLELERAFDWPFFIAERGGDPLLWQHLFWFFGHPEVYIISLPAAGLVSMMIPTLARTSLAGYRPSSPG